MPLNDKNNMLIKVKEKYKEKQNTMVRGIN